MCTRFIWLKVSVCGGLLWTWLWTFGLHKVHGIFVVAEQLWAPQETLSSVELVTSVVETSVAPRCSYPRARQHGGITQRGTIWMFSNAQWNSCLRFLSEAVDLYTKERKTLNEGNLALRLLTWDHWNWTLNALNWGILNGGSVTFGHSLSTFVILWLLRFTCWWLGLQYCILMSLRPGASAFCWLT
jgi:hypothetical protein